MKILAIGDFHGKFPKKLEREAKKADLVLSIGDFGGSKKLLKIVFKHLHKGWWKVVEKKKAREYILEDYNSGKKVIRALNKIGVPVYTIHGNWDFEGRKKERTGGVKVVNYSHLMKKMKNMNFLRKRIVNIKGMIVYAFGGYVIPDVALTKKGGHNKIKIKRFKKEYAKSKKQLFNKPGKNIDILLAHYPPYGYFDVVKYKGENPRNGQHVGFKPYTQYIKKYKPKLFICGHMHEYQGKAKLGNTIIVSTGPAEEGKAAIIEFDERKKKVGKIRFVK